MQLIKIINIIYIFMYLIFNKTAIIYCVEFLYKTLLSSSYVEMFDLH